MWLTSDEFNVVHASDASISTETASSAETCARVNMGRYQSMMAIVQMGKNDVTTNQLWVRVQAAVSTLPTATTAIALGGTTGAWTYRYATSDAVSASTADANPVYSARTAGTSTALTLNTGAGATYIIEVKSDDLPEGYPYLSLSISAALAFRPCTVTYILKPRYPLLNMINSQS